MEAKLRAIGRHPFANAANDNEAGPGTAGPRASIIRDYLVLLAVLAGTALFYWLAVLFFDWDRLQACIAVGKPNCAAPIEANAP